MIGEYSDVLQTAQFLFLISSLIKKIALVDNFGIVVRIFFSMVFFRLQSFAD